MLPNNELCQHQHANAEAWPGHFLLTNAVIFCRAPNCHFRYNCNPPFPSFLKLFPEISQSFRCVAMFSLMVYDPQHNGCQLGSLHFRSSTSNHLSLLTLLLGGSTAIKRFVVCCLLFVFKVEQYETIAIIPKPLCDVDHDEGVGQDFGNSFKCLTNCVLFSCKAWAEGVI